MRFHWTCHQFFVTEERTEKQPSRRTVISATDDFKTQHEGRKCIHSFSNSVGDKKEEKTVDIDSGFKKIKLSIVF